MNRYSAKLLAWVNRTKLGMRSLYNFWKRSASEKRLGTTDLNSLFNTHVNEATDRKKKKKI